MFVTFESNSIPHRDTLLGNSAMYRFDPFSSFFLATLVAYTPFSYLDSLSSTVNKLNSITGIAMISATDKNSLIKTVVSMYDAWTTYITWTRGGPRGSRVDVEGSIQSHSFLNDHSQLH